jgi:ppGpp synthetase/RelA/SpoT-type nucleotidyltranferase
MNLITWHLTATFIWQNLIYPYLTYPDLTKIVIMIVKNLLENNIKVELILSLIIHTKTRFSIPGFLNRRVATWQRVVADFVGIVISWEFSIGLFQIS